MPRILVLYYSRQGSVLSLANEIANGIESVDEAEAILRTVPAVSTTVEATEPSIPEQGDIYATAADLEQCDGLLLGSPCRFGTIASPLKYYFDQCTPQWLSGALKDKPAAVFTSSSSMHGGQESTLLSMTLPLLHHGMVILGIPFTGSGLDQTSSGGTPYGASHVDGHGRPVNDEEKKLAFYLGQRVARCAYALKGQTL